MAFKQKSPIAILEGGTNTQSFLHAFGVAYYDGSALNNIDPGVSGYVLTSNGSGGAASFQAISAHGAITAVDGNTGSITPTAGVINIVGDGTIMSTSGSGDTLTITTTAATTIDGDSGSAIVSSNTFNIIGSGSISTSGSGNTITISGSDIHFTWNDNSGGSIVMVAGNGYVDNGVDTPTIYTLPLTSSVGDEVAVLGSSTNLWQIGQNDGQTIHFNAADTTTGSGGSVSSTNRYDSITLICNIANTDWVAYQSTGNLSVV